MTKTTNDFSSPCPPTSKPCPQASKPQPVFPSCTPGMPPAATQQDGQPHTAIPDRNHPQPTPPCALNPGAQVMEGATAERFASCLTAAGTGRTSGSRQQEAMNQSRNLSNSCLGLQSVAIHSGKRKPAGAAVSSVRPHFTKTVPKYQGLAAVRSLLAVREYISVPALSCCRIVCFKRLTSQ